MTKFKEYDKQKVNFLSKKNDLPQYVIKLLLNRNINEEEMLDFLIKDYKLSNPFLLNDMTKATDRILNAIDKGENIIIFGDYDVDGMIASTMLYNFLYQINANVSLHIPDRMKDGYGMSINQIIYLDEKKEANLIISVDTGITAFEPINEANKRGIDVIITDHHEISLDGLPEAFAIVNPKINKSKLSYLAGAGVAFYLVRALAFLISKKSQNKKPKIVDSLVFAMIATIADMVPLIGDNRLIVDKGISFLYETSNVGLNFLLDAIKFYDYPNAIDLSFKLSPILNAAGRLEKTDLVLELLTVRDLTINKISKEIVELNNLRKKMTEEQFQIAQELVDDTKNFIVVSSDKFHQGLIGLIANKLVEKYGKPSIVISILNEKEAKASGRGISGVNMKEIVIDKLSAFHQGGGGHEMAIGFSILNNQIEIFDKEINKLKYEEINFDKEVEIELMHEDLMDNEFKRYMQRLEPFGQSNPPPFVEVTFNKFSRYKSYKNNHFHFQIDNNVEVWFFFAKNEKSKIENISQSDCSFKVLGELISDGEKIKILGEKIEKV